MGTQKKKKTHNSQWLLMLGYMLIGGVCGYLIMSYLEHVPDSDSIKSESIVRLVLLFLCMYGAMVIQIIIHEAGHLVFGLATGYHFVSFRIFSMMWIKENGKIHFKRMSIAGTGGQCLMSPPDLKDGKMPFKLYNYGGALLNLISAFIFAGVVLLFPAWSFAQIVMLFLAIIGFAFALINGLPFGVGPVNNDGRNAHDLSANPEALRAFWIQMKVNEMISRGIRIKDLPEEWFVMPSDEAMNNAIIATVGVLACSRLMDENRFEEADQMMEHILSAENGVVGVYRALLSCDRLYVELIGQNRRDITDRIMNDEQRKIIKAMKNYPSVLRTEYANALISEKNSKKAETIRKRFDKIAKTYPYPSEILGELELMDIAAKKAQ